MSLSWIMSEDYRAGQLLGPRTLAYPIGRECRANFTVLTGIETKRGSAFTAQLGKTYTLAGETIVKRSSPGASRFAIASLSINDLEDLTDALNNLQNSQAITTSVFKDETAVIAVPQNEYRRLRPSEAIGHATRTKADMQWPEGPGWFNIDVDPQDDKADVYPVEYRKPMSAVKILNKFYAAVPELAEYGVVVKPSSSSFIRSKCGTVQKGAGGWRLFFHVKDATDIPRAAKALYGRLWLAGFGYGIATAAGSFQPRSLMDMAIYQPARLDYQGKPTLCPNLERYECGAYITGGMEDMLDTKAVIKSLSKAERNEVNDLMDEVFDRMQASCEEIRYQWAEKRVFTRAKKDGVSMPSGKELKKLVNREIMLIEGGVLGPEHTIWVRDPGGTLATRDQQINGEWSPVNVYDIMVDPEMFHEVQTLDPVEPEYHDYGQVGIIYNRDGIVTLRSQAHGGASYKLAKDEVEARFLAGVLRKGVNDG